MAERKKEWEKNQKKWLLQPQQWKKRLSTLSNISSLSANFLSVDKAARYIGGEINSVMKNLDGIDVRVAFCFPDV